MRRLLSLFTLPLLLVGTAAAAQTTPTINFYSNWTLSQSAPMFAGGEAAIAYDTNRLPQCRTTLPDGSPGWSITGYYSLNGGPAIGFDVAGQPVTGLPAVIALPTSGRMQMWFRVASAGCEQYDSNYGTNFHFNVHPADATVHPTLVFQKGWVEYTVGTLKQGQPFTIDYDIDRLPECRLLYNGAPTWEVAVFYRFDYGEIQSTSVTQVTNIFSKTRTLVTLTPPSYARSVTMWFDNWDRGTCRKTDNNVGGRNYSFALQP